METRAHHVLIGLFTLVVVCTALGFGLWMGKTASDRQFLVFDIAFNESVGGLSKGSTVEFNGIKVGDVVSLRLDPDDARRVFARVSVDSEAPVRTDTRASLVAAGITGMSIIRLSSGDDRTSRPLREMKQEDEDVVPVIVATPSSLNLLLSEGEDLMSSLNQVLVQARDLLSDDNVASIGRTLRNVEQITATVAEQGDGIGELLADARRLSEQAGTLMQAFSQLVDSSREVLDQQAGSTLHEVRQAVQSFAQTMQSVDSLVNDNRPYVNRAMRGAAELGPAFAELRDILMSLRVITRQLEDNPTDYLLGNEQLKEFRP